MRPGSPLSRGRAEKTHRRNTIRSFPRKRESSNLFLKSKILVLGPRFRGDERNGKNSPNSPLIPAHSRPKDGVLSHAYAGIQYCLSKQHFVLGPRFRGDERNGKYSPHSPLIPAQAGIQYCFAGTSGTERTRQIRRSFPRIAVRRTACFRTP